MKYIGREKEYQKEYYRTHKEKLKARSRLYYEENREDCRKKQNEYSKEYSKRPEIRIKKYKWTAEWKRRNPDKVKLYLSKHPEKLRARKYAYHHKQRGTHCIRCFRKEDLHFHHTDYEKNEDITLCQPCHVKKHYPKETIYVIKELEGK